jgi:hypothetical protein
MPIDAREHEHIKSAVQHACGPRDLDQRDWFVDTVSPLLSDDDHFAHQVALVTGAAQGWGGCRTLLAQRGAAVHPPT